MKKVILVAFMFLLMSSVAYATPPFTPPGLDRGGNVEFNSKIDNKNTNNNLNSNKNTNNNLNLNSSESSSKALAIQGQLQGQAQGQTQSLSNTNAGNASVSNSGNSSSSSSISNSGNATIVQAADIRELPVPTAVMVSTTAPEVAAPDYTDMGPNFLDIQTLADILNAVDVSTAEAKGDVKVVTQVLSKGEATDAPIVFAVKGDNKVPADFKPLAVVTVRADSMKDVNSATLAVLLAKQAKKLGGTTVLLAREGVSKRMTSWGVGIGLSYNMASVGSSPSDNGYVGAGGTGWSMAEGEYESLPYLTAIIGQ